jgi:hypothetical protein
MGEGLSKTIQNCVTLLEMGRHFSNLIVLADGRQEDDEHDVLEAVDPLPAFVTLTSNVNLIKKSKICTSYYKSLYCNN